MTDPRSILANELAALPLDQSHDTWPTCVPVRLTETARELIVTALRADRAPHLSGLGGAL